jgi:hypothetical protein
MPSLRPILLAGLAIAPLVLAAGACGGGQKPAETPAAASAATPSEDAGGASTESTEPAPAASAAPGEEKKEPASEAPSPAASAGSTKTTMKSESSWSTCHEVVKAKGKDLSKEVAAMAKGCAKATKMKPVGKTITGKQSDSGSPQTYPLKAAAKHCYRVYAQGAEGIKDLNVAIKDSTGAIAAQDSTSASNAVVPADGAVCFKEKDAASVVVSVGSGSGAYAVQIWGE